MFISKKQFKKLNIDLGDVMRHAEALDREAQRAEFRVKELVKLIDILADNAGIKIVSVEAIPAHFEAAKLKKTRKK